jgi:hypothetical protein
MIVINLMGGLGNQMFQYAAAKHLATLNNAELLIDASNFKKLTANSDHTFQLSYFKIQARQATRDEILRVIRPSNFVRRVIDSVVGKPPHKLKSKTIFKEPAGSNFKPYFLELKGDQYLIGYYNSFKYFSPIRNTLIAEFKPKGEISTQGQEMQRLIESTNSVSLHIRRGDYVDNPDVYKCIEGIITDRYYQNAVKLIAERVNHPHFFVFSNDMEWVRQNFKIPYEVTYVDINSAQSGFEDLWLMSKCKHNITAGGSTFSWWAAYLNTNGHKIIVRTKQVSNDLTYNNPGDYFPETWESVES